MTPDPRTARMDAFELQQQAFAWAQEFEEGERSVFLAAEGPARQSFFHSFEKEQARAINDTALHGDAWLIRGPITALQDAVEQAWVAPTADPPRWWPPPTVTWSLLWSLATIPELLIFDPLRGFADQHSTLLFDLFRAVWHLRFSLTEEGDLFSSAQLIETAGAWFCGRTLEPVDTQRLGDWGITRKIETVKDKMDALCFLLSLATQNGLFDRFYMTFDGVEQASTEFQQELSTLLLAGNRWSRLPQMPLGLLVGWDGNRVGLRKSSPRLAQLIARDP